MNQERRLSLHPIQFPKIWEMNAAQEKNTWFRNDKDFYEDTLGFKKLSPIFRGVIEDVYGILDISDTIVGDNLDSIKAKLPSFYIEGKHFINNQIRMEDIHTNTYSSQLTEIISDFSRVNDIRQRILSRPHFTRKTELMSKYRDTDHFGWEIIANGLNEAVGFSELFATINKFATDPATSQFLPATYYFNEKISVDEAIHFAGSGVMYRDCCEFEKQGSIKHKVSVDYEDLKYLCREFVEIEIDCIKGILDKKDTHKELKELTIQNISQYIQYICDLYVGEHLKQKKIFNVGNSLPYMELFNMKYKSNFFEKHVAEYQKGIEKKKIVGSVKMLMF